MIEPVRAKLDRDALELLERVREQQELALGVDRGALRAGRIPRVPYLQPPIGRVHVEVARATDDIAGSAVAHGEWHRAEILAHLERGIDIRPGLVGCWYRRVPQPPQLAVGRGTPQICFVLPRERLE